MSRMRRRQSDSGIQLTPMIDVMTVLLAVFMVTTPMMTTGIDLELPRAGASAMTGNDHAIQISVDARGRYFLSEMELPRDEVVKRAIAMRGENPNLTIMISGDTHADYGAVMSMMGKLKDVGFQKVGLRTQPE
ncbi:MAG: biopolymer transporter ExbD [Alphaproteobacteria bacterium]|nr:biopolymer transporter ExbD [Alphaproteobacteria bacterium]MBQ8256160.1 biopolymer transporter ExbD [Alphaproteobacteria bacterium]MDW2958626.1 biopolymer transporter ExbD [Alphaproteobacteria bacterium]